MIENIRIYDKENIDRQRLSVEPYNGIIRQSL